MLSKEKYKEIKRGNGQQILLSQNHAININEEKSNNVLLFGASGTGKDMSFVYPNLLAAEYTNIVIDPDGNSYEKLKNILTEKGIEVKVVDFTGNKDFGRNKVKYDPFDYLKDKDDIRNFAVLFCEWVENELFYDEQSQFDPFFKIVRRNIINYTLMILKERNGKISAQNVLEFCASDLVETSLKEKWYEYDPDISESRYSLFSMTKTTFKPILDSVTLEIIRFCQKIMKSNKASDRPLGIASLVRKPCVLFVAVSQIEFSYMPALFISQISELLFKTEFLPKTRKSYENHIQFVLNEASNIGKINELDRYMSVGRMRNVGYSIIFNNITQFRKVYSAQYENIIANCNNIMLSGGPVNDETIDFFIKRNPCSKELGSLKLMTKIRKLPMKQCMIMNGGEMIFDEKNVAMS